MIIDGSTKIVGVFGYPVKHTASPCMHNAAFESLSMNWVYLPFEVSPDKLKIAAQSLSPLNIQGVNVTIPHKRGIVAFVDELSPGAEFIGAVNTIVIKDGELIGYNTDGEGFIKALEEEGISASGKRILVVGAGGASYGITRSLLLESAGGLSVVNRTIEKAKDLQKRVREGKLSNGIEVLPFDNDSISKVLQDADIIVNTTSVGMKESDPILIDEKLLNSSLEAVIDIIYSPAETKLLKAAKNKGIKTLNGLGMLLHQGALSFELWTGRKAPIEVMRKALYKQFKM